MDRELFIIKASGKTVRFSESKLRASLQHSGATGQQIDRVLEEISPKLYPGISTKKIYKLAYGMLKRNSKSTAAKYHLKGAIMELGPSGFPFEKFIGELLRYQGYDIKIGQIVQGQCVHHEVDVVATLNQQQLMIECKYHNLQGSICDVKIPLYIHSRFRDIEIQLLKSADNKGNSYEGWVITNTRFSDDAIQYGTCAGLKLLGWDYPLNASLKDLIDTLGLYPVTCLTTLAKHEKQFLLAKNTVLCMDLLNNQNLLEQAGINASRIDKVMEEVHQLCKLLIENGRSKIPFS